MSESRNDKRNDKRKLTPFLAHEMLFDFATGQLDADRKRAIENFIREDAESRNLLEAIRRGIAYAESLRSIDLTEETIHELDQSENLVSLSKRLARWSEWPDSLRWSIVALGISACTAALVVAIPWKSIPLFKGGPTFDSSLIEIARVESRKAQPDDLGVAGGAADTSDEVVENETGPLEGSGDEEFSGDVSPPLPVPPVAVAAKPALASPPVVPLASTMALAAKVAAPTVPVPPVPTATSKPVSAVVAAAPQAPAVSPAAAAKASRSYVYRAFMTLSGLEDIAPKITQQMKELGVEKAGEVELGWRRGTGRYFHFTIPENNEQKLLESLRVYGPVRISKDPHPRVMPEGQVRFILWIESGT